jgi:WD40 repeat protein/tRNA A-37 threonylcarbamoyl transferase component Bud32
MTMLPCPARDRLTGLLDETLSDEERREIEIHVESCPACQKVLDGLASTGITPLRAVPPTTFHFGGDDEAFLERLKQHPAGGDPPSAPEEGAAAPPPSVPGYELLAELGRGGMGVVYKARQTSLGRLVALKLLLHGARASDVERRRLRAEAEALAQLQHPHIVQVFEVGEHDDLPYLALELVEGHTLAQAVHRTPQPSRETARLVEVLARAVHAAHERGVVHRDLKPANVLMTADGVPKVTDFGLAKRLEGAEPLTRPGHVMGTPTYMAPEQADPRRGAIGPAVDVYALGTILYELLTGRPPFLGDTPLDTLLLVVREEPVPPTRLRPRVPRDLETICLKCLEKEPVRRYASAAELADDLLRFVNGEPVRARPVGAAGRAARWVRRHPAVSALTAAVVLVALAGVGGVVWKWRDEVRARHDADARKDEALGLARQEQAARKDAETAWGKEREAHKESDRLRGVADEEKATALREWRRAEGLRYSGQIESARQALDAGNAPLALSLLDAARWDLRGWEHRHLYGRVKGRAATVLQHGPLLNAVAYSRDGRWIAVAGQDGAIRLWEAATGGEGRLLKGHTSWAAAVAFSPDSRRLASGGNDGTLRLWELPEGREGPTVPSRAGLVRAVAYSPRGDRIAGGCKDGTVRLWDSATGAEVGVLRGHAKLVFDVAFSPDAKRLASAALDHTVRVWDTASLRQETVLWPGHNEGIDCVAFSPDGKRLAAGDGAHSVALWNTDGWGLERTLAAGANGPSRLAFSPDSKRLAGTGDNPLAPGHPGEVWLWDPDTGDRLLTLTGPKSAAFGLAFSPDGNRLVAASADGTVHVWDAVATRRVYPLRGHAGTVDFVAFSRDGTRLVTGGNDGTARVWDARTGQEVAALPVTAGRIGGLGLNPDGTRIAVAGDGRVRLWDAAAGRQLLTLGEGKDAVTHVAFSANGTRVAALYQFNRIVVWDVPTGRELMRLTLVNHSSLTGLTLDRVLSGIALSPDGQRLAAACEDKVRTWDVQTGRAMLEVGARPSHPEQVAFGPDGSRLYGLNRDGTLFGWDAETGKAAPTVRGLKNDNWGFAVSPDGRRVAAAAGKGTVRVWDAETGREVFSRQLDKQALYEVTFAPDGKRLACGGFDAAYVVNLDAEESP